MNTRITRKVEEPAYDSTPFCKRCMSEKQRSTARTGEGVCDTYKIEREVEVLLLLGHGTTYTEIATALFISQSTVRNHVYNIKAKLEIHDRAELLKLAKAVAARTEAA